MHSSRPKNPRPTTPIPISKLKRISSEPNTRHERDEVSRTSLDEKETEHKTTLAHFGIDDYDPGVLSLLEGFPEEEEEEEESKLSEFTPFQFNLSASSHRINNSPLIRNGSPARLTINRSPALNGKITNIQIDIKPAPPTSDTSHANVNVTIDPSLQWSETNATPSAEIKPQRLSIRAISPMQLEAITDTDDLNNSSSLIPLRPTLLPNHEGTCRQAIKFLVFHAALALLVSFNAINAALDASNTKPSDVSLKWWDGLSPAIKARTIVNFTFSLGANMYVLRDFLPSALDELENSIRESRHSYQKFATNLFSWIVSAVAALAFAAMAMDAFQWAGGFAFLPSIMSFCSSFITRYPNVIKIQRRIKWHFNHDMQFQRDMAKKLRSLKEAYIHLINQHIRDKHYRIDKVDVLLLLNEIGAMLERPTEQLTIIKNRKALGIDYSLITLKALYQTAVVAAAWVIFTQKGFDGINILLKHNLSHLNLFLEGMIGCTAGLVSASVYYLATTQFPQLLFYVLKELIGDLIDAAKSLTHPRSAIAKLIDHPARLKRFLSLSLGLIANGFASGAMVTVGKLVASNKKGIFYGLLGLNFFKTLLPLCSGMGGISINGRGTLSQILKKEESARKEEPFLNDVIVYIEDNLLFENNTTAPVNTPPLPTVASLKHFSFFNTQPVNGDYQLLDQPRRRSICEKMCVIS